MRRLGTSTTASLVRPPGELDELGETVIETAIWETLVFARGVEPVITTALVAIASVYVSKIRRN